MPRLVPSVIDHHFFHRNMGPAQYLRQLFPSAVAAKKMHLLYFFPLADQLRQPARVISGSDDGGLAKILLCQIPCRSTQAVDRPRRLLFTQPGCNGFHGATTCKNCAEWLAAQPLNFFGERGVLDAPGTNESSHVDDIPFFLSRKFDVNA